MAALGFRLRAEARSRWRAWVGLAVLIGVFAGAVLAVAAGARRTDTAYQRFTVAARAADVLVFSVPGGALATVDFDQVRRLPEVQDSALSAQYPTDQPAVQLAAMSDGYGTRFNRFRLLSGRLPDPERMDETAIGFTLAESRHLRVGSTLDIGLVPATGVDHGASDGGGQAAMVAPPRAVLKVVGVEAGPGEFPPQIGTGTQPAWVTPAFARAHATDIIGESVLALRLRGGAGDVPAFKATVQGMGGGKPVAIDELGPQAASVQRSLHLQAVALGILALLGGLTVGLVCGQLLGRATALESVDHPALAAVGMTGRQLWSLGLARAVLIGTGAGLVAGAIAVALSPLFPIGLAGNAEPTPGIQVDAVLVVGGIVAVVVAVVLLVAVSTWRLAGSAARGVAAGAAGARQKPSAVAELLARAGSPPTVTAGVRMALEPGRGRTAVPIRTTVIGSVVAITALAAALTFQASLSHLLSTPRLYGVTFDAEVNRTSGDDITLGPATPALLADPEVADLAVGYSAAPVRVGDVDAGALALQVDKGTLPPPLILEGRAPTATDEVALGTRTLHDLGAHVGQTVDAVLPESTAHPVPVRIVGRAVLPQADASAGLGRGTVATIDGVRRLAGDSGEFPDPTNAFLRFPPGADKARARARLQDRLDATLGKGWTVAAPERPTDVVNFGHVQNLPVVLAAVLALLAAATIGHLLVSSVRRRRRDLAVLKSLGFVRRQVMATVGWQATTLVVVALIPGVPLGVAVGRRTWDVLALQLGIAAQPITPVVALLVLVPAALVLANAVAAAPAWSAGRTQAAIVLRSE